jgi:ABC-type arginine transport system permease subunit
MYFQPQLFMVKLSVLWLPLSKQSNLISIFVVIDLAKLINVAKAFIVETFTFQTMVALRLNLFLSALVSQPTAYQ